MDIGVISNVEIHLHPVLHPGNYGGFHESRREGIILNEQFNRLIVGIAISELKKGRSVLLVTRSKRDQGPMLVRFFREQGYEVPFVSGDTKNKSRKQAREAFRDGHLKCLIGTVYREGVDFPLCDCGILCDGGLDEKNTIQFLGRILRKPIGSGKEMAYLHDFVHKNDKHLRKHSVQRVNDYLDEELENFKEHDPVTLEPIVLKEETA